MFVLELPGEPMAITIEVGIETKPLIYGKRWKNKPSILLTHNSGFRHEIRLEPAPVLYNAFPDLNYVAEDGSYSAPPIGAKFMLPLACIFNPYAIYKELDNAHSLTGLPGYKRLYEDDETRAFFVAMPRNSAVENEFKACAIFEHAHARLAATHYKWMFRAELLGPFYNTLWHWLSSKREMGVPLIPDPNGSKLQLQWCQINNWFLETCLLDEACSLLVEVAFINDKQERDLDERRWIQAEDRAMQGKFAPFYRKLRMQIESLYGGDLDSCSTENERFTFAELAVACCSMVYDGMAATGMSDPEPFLDGKNAWIKTPLYDHKPIKAFYDQLPNLHRRLGDLQVNLGLQLMLDEDQYSYIDKPHFGQNAPKRILELFRNEKAQRRFPKQYFYTQNEITNEGVFFIPVTPTDQLINLLASSKSELPGDWQFKQYISKFKVIHTIFLESIRQQICHGVGLCCPFWNGACCQQRGFRKDYRELLKNAYKITKPWLWRQHWNKPPCLDE
jgi:hypothetical protein